MKFITYYRVSTQQQGQSGLGIEAQQSAVAAHVASVGGEVFAEYVEVESGKKNDRPKLEAALKRCRLSGATLLVAKLDRLSRNAAFLMKLQESSVQFTAADMPQANSFTVGIMALMAEQERLMISQRTKAALAAAKARGVKLGNIDTLTNRDVTAANKTRLSNAAARNAEIYSVIVEIQSEHSESLSLRAIASKLNTAGYKTSRGAEFKAQSVKRIIAAQDKAQQEQAA